MFAVGSFVLLATTSGIVIVTETSTASATTGASDAGLATQHRVVGAGVARAGTPSSGQGGTSIFAWGNNSSGQLGIGKTTNRRKPVAVSGLDGAVSVTAGFDHSCALLSGGTAECWGSNNVGAVGDGTTITRLAPVPVTGLSHVVAISAGGVGPGYGDFSCAVISGGRVECWGDNLFGQLGDGTTVNRFTPVTVRGLTGATAISTGGGSACALLAGGTAKCWGNNFSGQLGDGTGQQFVQATPVTVSGLKDATAISVGGATACAQLSNRTVKCWGANTTGAVGDGTTKNRYTPIVVSGLVDVVAVGVAGDPTGNFDYSCALRADKTVTCWGSNQHGQLGDGTTTTRLRPVTTSGVADVTAITVGGEHSCALLAGRTIKCWGRNTHGELGDGTTTTRLRPHNVTGVTSAVAITAGIQNTFARAH